MSSSEFEEWKLFHRLEPFGQVRDDLRAGTVAAVIANANRDPKKKRQAYTPRDFMPRYELDDEPADQPATLMEKARLINAALGGEDRRG